MRNLDEMTMEKTHPGRGFHIVFISIEDLLVSKNLLFIDYEVITIGN